ncbi:MAG: hypothetical protein Q7J98_12240, partial [Kiritimatiellia bacterium]|nr:hypothetical protein [Kiritimatiellia bacterium]
QTNEALATAKSGLDALNNKKSGPAPRLQLQVFLAELACDQNDGRLALKELDKLDAGQLKSSDANVQAKAAIARGRALLIGKRPAEAALCFDNAAAFYQKAQRFLDMAIALQQAGVAYESADKRQEAFNRHYRAARSFFICGENIRAEESFNKANELAKESGDKQMVSALSRLKTETGPDAENKTAPEKVQTE